jgi:hypothetical protein
MILRECIRHEPLAEMALNDPAVLDPLFNYVQLSTFDVASDAFQTFKVKRVLHAPRDQQDLLADAAHEAQGNQHGVLREELRTGWAAPRTVIP